MKKKRALAASRDPDYEPEQPGSKPLTHWVVELEEDPETGDLMMPLPPALLEDLGWKIGDTLTWKIDETGDISLTKSK